MTEPVDYQHEVAVLALAATRGVVLAEMLRDVEQTIFTPGQLAVLHNGQPMLETLVYDGPTPGEVLAAIERLGRLVGLDIDTSGLETL